MVTPLTSALTFGFQRNAVAEALAYLRNPLGGLLPGRGLSLREIGRQLGINESTLRTAFYTPGRGPSQRTLDRISRGFATTDLLITRQRFEDTYQEAIRPGSGGDTFMTYTRPADAQSFRMVVKVTDDPKYEYKTLTQTVYSDVSPDDYLLSLRDNEQFERIIWYTGEGGVIR
jgi:hypothetical protein